MISASTQSDIVSQGHFRDERTDAKKTKVDEQGNKYKRQNAAQQMKPHTRMPGVAGLIPYSKVGRKAFVGDLYVEICHRQAHLHCHGPIANKVKKMKEFLQLLESIHLIEEENLPIEQARGNKSFKKQSNATFRLPE